MKICTHCGQTLQLSEFHRQTRSKDGLTPHCKACNRLRVQRWREANPVRAAASVAAAKAKAPERYRALAKAYRTRNAGRLTEAQRQRRLANPERTRAAYLSWLDANAAKKSETDRAWRAAHPEQYKQNRRINEAARRARKNGCPPELRMTASEWSAIKADFKGRCAYCLAESESLQIEHMVPLSRGGWHVASNVVPACAACNRSKGARTSVEFIGAVA